MSINFLKLGLKGILFFSLGRRDLNYCTNSRPSSQDRHRHRSAAAPAQLFIRKRPRCLLSRTARLFTPSTIFVPQSSVEPLTFGLTLLSSTCCYTVSKNGAKINDVKLRESFRSSVQVICDKESDVLLCPGEVWLPKAGKLDNRKGIAWNHDLHASLWSSAMGAISCLPRDASLLASGKG